MLQQEFPACCLGPAQSSLALAGSCCKSAMARRPRSVAALAQASAAQRPWMSTRTAAGAGNRPHGMAPATVSPRSAQHARHSSIRFWQILHGKDRPLFGSRFCKSASCMTDGGYLASKLLTLAMMRRLSVDPSPQVRRLATCRCLSPGGRPAVHPGRWLDGSAAQQAVEVWTHSPTRAVLMSAGLCHRTCTHVLVVTVAQV